MSSSRASFTLIELLITISIVTVVSVVSIIILNPVQLQKQARDSNRLADMNSLSKALSFFVADTNGALGSTSTIYVSVADPVATSSAGTQCQGLGLPTASYGWTYRCSASSTLKNTDGTGWIPVNLGQASFQALASLPTDPLNSTSSRTYYTYTTASGFAVTAALESDKYKMAGSADQVSTDGGSIAGLFEAGSNIGITPVDYSDSALMGWWRFNEGTGTSTGDSSGGGRTGTLTNSPTWTSTGCIQGQCLTFDGSNDYIGLSSLHVPSALTITAWVKLNGVSANNRHSIVSRWGDSNSYALVYADDSDQIGDFIAGPTNSTFWRSFNLEDGVWHFVAMTYDGSEQRLYVDGAQLGATVASTGSINNNNALLRFGYDNSGFGGAYLNGLMDDIRIYNRGLSASEVQALYNATR